MINPGPRWRRCADCGRLRLVVQSDSDYQPAITQAVVGDCRCHARAARLTPARLLERCTLSAAADAVASRLLASVFPHGLPG
jgi:hypothetical protein